MEIVFEIDGVRIPIEWVDSKAMKNELIKYLTSVKGAKMKAGSLSINDDSMNVVMQLLFECED